jgi:hypothetical protein
VPHTPLYCCYPIMPIIWVFVQCIWLWFWQMKQGSNTNFLLFATIKCWELGTAQVSARRREGFAHIHYLSTDSIKPSLQFSCNFVVINASEGPHCYQFFILHNSRCQVLCGSCKKLPRTSRQCCSFGFIGASTIKCWKWICRSTRIKSNIYDDSSQSFRFQFYYLLLLEPT